MNFELFIKEVKTTIKNYLPSEYQSARIDIVSQIKLNESYMGMSVKTDKQKIVPVINLNMYYEWYCNAKKEMSNIMEHMADTIQRTYVHIELEYLRNYNLAKEKLFIRVSDVERNQYALKNMPYTLIENLAITYHIYMDFDGTQIACAPVNNQMLQEFGIVKEQLHQDALKNSPRLLPPKTELLEDIVERKLREELSDAGWSKEGIDTMLEVNSDSFKSPLVVVSNNIHIYGSAVIFYPGQLDEIGKLMKGNYFILPSSIHETMVLRDNGEHDYRGLKEIVMNVNNINVLPDEKLTDEVYHYDVKEKIFEKAISYEERRMLSLYESVD